MTEKPNPHELRRWLIMMAEAGGRLAVYRVRADRAAASLPILISVKWPYAEQNENGFPRAVLQRSMDAFETAFEAITEADLVLVTTGMGLKEWVLYTADVDAFAVEFKRLLRGRVPAPVTITHRADPLWHCWLQVRKHAKPHLAASRSPQAVGGNASAPEQIRLLRRS
jgi:hypothetical protein